MAEEEKKEATPQPTPLKFPGVDETVPFLSHPQAGPEQIGTSFTPGFKDDKIGFAADVIRGIGHAPFKFAYDLGSLAHDPKDVGNDYWEAISWLGDDSNNTIKASGSAATFLGTWQASAAQLAKIPTIGKALQGTSSWKKIAALIGIGGAAEIPASMIHTRKNDGSMLELVPEEYRLDMFNWFMDREDDSELEGRFKNAVEGMALGSGLELAGAGLASVFRSMKRTLQGTANNTAELAANTDQFLTGGQGQGANNTLKNNSTVGGAMEDQLERNAYQGDIFSVPENELAVGINQRGRVRADMPNAAQKELEVNRKLDQTDVDYKPTTEHKTAASQRLAEDAYDHLDILNNKPTIDSVARDLDHKAFQADREVLDFLSADTARAREIAELKLRDPNTSKADKKFYKEFLHDPTADTARIRGKTSGDISTDSTLRLAKFIQHRSGIKPKNAPKRSKDSMILEATKKYREGKLWDEIRDTAKEIGVHPETLATQAARLEAVLGSSEDILTALRFGRADLRNQVESLSKKLAQKTNPEELLRDPEFQKWLLQVAQLDGLDRGLAGAQGSVGRMLNSLNYSPDDFGAILTADIENKMRISNQVAKDRKALRKELIGKGLTKKEIDARVKEIADPLEDETLTDSLARSVLEEDYKAITRIINQLANDASGKGLKNAIQGPGLYNMWANFFRSSLLSGPGTLVSSVGLGGATQTAWKWLAVKPIQGLIGDLAASVGQRGWTGGASVLDTVYGGMAMLRETYGLTTKFAHNVIKGGPKRIGQLVDLGFDSFREGTENVGATRKIIKDQWDATIKYYDDHNMWAKASIARLASSTQGVFGSFGNFMGRRIQDADDYWKAMNVAATLEVKAARAWRREGADVLFNGKISREDFIKRYKEYASKVSKIHADEAMSPNAKNDAIDALFGSNTGFRDEIVESLSEAKRIAQEATLQQDVGDTILGGIIKGIEDKTASNPAFRGASLLLIPFRKTPINALSEAMLNTPAALTTKRFWNTLKNGTTEEKGRVTAQIVAGTGAVVMISEWFDQDRLTGAFKPSERRALEAVGKKDYSIRIGDTWYSYEKLGPVGTLLASIATYRESEESFNDEGADIALKVWSHSLALAADQGHIRTFEELATAMTSDKPFDSMSKLLIQKGSKALLPAQGAIKTIADWVDPTKNIAAADAEISGSMQWMSHIVKNSFKNDGIINAMDKMFDTGIYQNDVGVTGESVAKYGTGLGNKFLHAMGIGNLSAETRPSLLAYDKHGLIPKGMLPVHKGIPLTEAQSKEYYTKVFHDDMLDFVDSFTQSYMYNRMTIPAKKAWLNKTLQARQKYVKAVIEGADPELQYKIRVKELYDHYKGLMRAEPVPDSGDEIKHHYQQKRFNKDLKEHKSREKFLEQLGVEVKKNE